MKVDFELGYTKEIVLACLKHDLLRNQAAYVLATAYHETGFTMEPVCEGDYLKGRVRDLEGWRKKNLKYYPWHGRGFVQLTWQSNYRKAGETLGVDLISDPDKALDPEIAIDALVIGLRDGWYTGKCLCDYMTLEASNYRGARRIVNGTDKAAVIAEYAREFEAALLKEGYGVESPPPVMNERRDGTPLRKSKLKSTTLQATAVTAVSGGSGVFAALSKLDPASQIIVIVCASVALMGIGWIARERIKMWAEGIR